MGCGRLAQLSLYQRNRRFIGAYLCQILRHVKLLDSLQAVNALTLVGHAVAYIGLLVTCGNCLDTSDAARTAVRSAVVSFKCPEQQRRRTAGFPQLRSPSVKLNSLLTYFLTPYSTVLLDKLTSLQLVNKFSAFYGTRMFITAFIRARHLSLS
jgi:hypothetical protein